VFAFRAPVAGVRLQGGAQLGDAGFLLVAAGEPVFRGVLARRAGLGQRAVQRGGQVPAFLGAAPGEALGDPDPGDDLDRAVEVLDADTADVLVLGQHRGAWVVPGRILFD